MLFQVLALLAALIVASLGDAQSDLTAAVSANDPVLLSAALAAGADINRPGSGGQTPLMQASLGGQAQSVAYLLSQGADPTLGEKDGYTPLHGAALQGRAEAARLLLNDARVPNVAHADGFFPVHRACWGREQRHTDTVRVFLESGEYQRKTADGKSLLDVAGSNKWTQELLKDWGSAAEEL